MCVSVSVCAVRRLYRTWFNQPWFGTLLMQWPRWLMSGPWYKMFNHPFFFFYGASAGLCGWSMVNTSCLVCVYFSYTPWLLHMLWSLHTLFSDTDSPVLATVDSQFCQTVRFMSDWSYLVLFICVVGVGAGVVISKLCWWCICDSVWPFHKRWDGEGGKKHCN